jgi:hypothetical protein
MMDDALNKAYACFDAKKKKKKNMWSFILSVDNLFIHSIEMHNCI